MEFFNIKNRKIIQYTLIACILIIQVFIVVFFWSEYLNRKNTSSIEKQIAEVENLERFTENSYSNFDDAKQSFKKYLKSQNIKDLESYYQSLSKLSSELKIIDSMASSSKNIGSTFDRKKNASNSKFNIQKVLDSVALEIKRNEILHSDNTLVTGVKKYQYEIPILNKQDVTTEKYSDTTKSKKFFGRIKDAITGKENVRKDSVVVTLKEIIEENSQKSRRIIDSLMLNAGKHYDKEFRKVEINVINKDSDTKAKYFNQIDQVYDLLNYSSNLVAFYDGNIKSIKKELLDQLNEQRLKNDSKRYNYALIAMVLMFIVSMFMLYFTRLTFFYEGKIREADKLNQQNLNFKNRILGMLTHELRSPLKSIGLFVNRIQKKTEDPKVKEYLKSIHFTSNSLLLQSNQILDYTKDQNLQKKLISTDFNLKSEIDNILSSIEPYIESRNNQYEIVADIDPNLNVYTDKTKINQLFVNIIGNANKFTENGIIKVHSHVLYDNESQKKRLKTEVLDTGTGIKEEDLISIFEPYYQGVISNDVDNLGAGLGLSLCKEIVTLFDGEINVESKFGKGTKVTFVLEL